jgi:hypothetical protein
MASPTIDDLLESIALLPEDWHAAGSVTMPVLRGLARLASARRIDHSIETGSGKTTLLLSHLSADHTVFAIDEYDGVDTRSIGNVRATPLLESSRVRFVEGPTQLTLPRHEFPHTLQLALIDGPHGYPFPDLEYYYVYPHLAEDALLVVDDIHIPTVRNLFDFLREDEMFQLLQVIENTAFFRRTPSPSSARPWTAGGSRLQQEALSDRLPRRRAAGSSAIVAEAVGPSPAAAALAPAAWKLTTPSGGAARPAGSCPRRRGLLGSAPVSESARETKCQRRKRSGRSSWPARTCARPWPQSRSS